MDGFKRGYNDSDLNNPKKKCGRGYDCVNYIYSMCLCIS